jgi:hypothetical protein
MLDVGKRRACRDALFAPKFAPASRRACRQVGSARQEPPIIRQSAAGLIGARLTSNPDPEGRISHVLDYCGHSHRRDGVAECQPDGRRQAMNRDARLELP